MSDPDEMTSLNFLAGLAAAAIGSVIGSVGAAMLILAVLRVLQ